MIDLSFWFMLPVAVVFATVAMMAGIGGAVLFSPFFIIVLKIEPLLALSAGLVIEFFGFTSGLIGYWYKKSIAFKIVRKLIIFTMPATVAGVFLGRLIPVSVLKSMLAMLILYLAYEFLLRGKECLPKDLRCTGIAPSDREVILTPLIKATSLFGGLLIGMISSGLGEINEYNFLKKLQLSVPLSSGTSVFLVAMSATVGSILHAYFLSREPSVFLNVLSLIVFTVPGVILGAQLGVRLSKTINTKVMGKFVGGLFLILGTTVLFTIFS